MTSNAPDHMDSLDWNDLQYVVAISRGHSAAAAARLLGVSHATVLRRIEVLERGIGAPLFYRLPTGYEPTPAGQKLVEAGSAIETVMTDARRSIESQSTDLTGTIRFTTTDDLASALMPSILKGFHERYPAIKVEMIVTSSRLDLDRREADVALRPTVQPPTSWVGTQVANLTWGPYASTKYLGRRQPRDWKSFAWIIPGGPLSKAAMVQWLKAEVPEDNQVMTVDSVIALRELALNGTGATLLPRYLVQDDRLKLLLDLPGKASGAGLWLLTHVNLRRTRRIKAFTQYVAESVRAALKESEVVAD